MNIDRKMVSLFFEIKRNMPYEQREDMKIASPELGAKLVGIYQESDNKSLKRLIEDFMVRAGDSWSAKLAPSTRTNVILSSLEALNPREILSRKNAIGDQKEAFSNQNEALSAPKGTVSEPKRVVSGKHEETISTKEALRRAKAKLEQQRSLAH